MQKNHKVLSVLSITAMSAIIAAAVSVPVKAADADIYLLNDLSKPAFTKAQTASFSTQKVIGLNAQNYGYELTGKVYKFEDLTAVYMAHNNNLTLTKAALPTEATSVGTAGVTTGLTVQSVSAINTTTVEVKFAATTEAKTGVTVTVKDATGATIAVKATNIAKGATFAQFDFVTPVLTANLTGVWTVDGNNYSFTAIKQLADIKVLAAATPLDQLTLATSLTAAGITSVDNSIIPAYATAITLATATTQSLADLQTVINKANTANGTATADAAVVKSVVEAKSQIDLYNVLNANFARVNSAWALSYASGAGSSAAGIELKVVSSVQANVIHTNATTGIGTTKADIQTAIDVVNAAKIATADSAANTSVKQVAVTALIQDYVVADDSTTPLVTPKATAIKASQVKEDVLKVAEATTANTVYSALVNLANLDATTLKIADLDSTLAVQYFSAQQTNNAALISAKTIASVVTNVITPAKAAASATLLTATQAPVASGVLGNVTDEAAVKTALTAFGVKNVLPTGYLTVTAKSDIAAATDLATLQTAVDDAGLVEVQAVIAAGTSGTVADEAKATQYLTSFGVKNVLATGYLTATAQSDIAAASDLATLQTAVNDATLVVNQTVQLKLINEATSATQVKSALDILAIASYVNVPSVDKLHIAEQILKVRDTLAAARNAVKADGTASGNITTVAKVFVDFGELAGTMDKASTGIIADYTALVADFNFTALTDTTTTVAQLTLLGYDAFDNLGAGVKANVAETFVANYPKDTVTPFGAINYKTLAAVKAAINVAIAAN